MARMIDTSFVGRVESSDRALFLVVVIGVVQHRRDSRAILTDSMGYGHLCSVPSIEKPPANASGWWLVVVVARKSRQQADGLGCVK